MAGAAAACLLGRDAVLIEREPGPHDKICGEFISAEAQPYLARLGLDLAGLGAVPIHTVRLIHGERAATSALPFTAYGLSRRALDEALLLRAAQSGAEVVRGHAVRGLVNGAFDVAGLGRMAAPALFLATGKHDLRGVRRQPSRAPERLVGLKMYLSLAWDEAAGLRGHVEVVLFPGGYAGLQLVEGGAANLCLLVEQRRFEEAGRTWPGVQALLERDSPHLARRLRAATARLDRPLTIFRVPYGFVHAPGPADPPGLFRLGDQAGVIPSFSGDGVSIALHSAFAAVAAQREGGAAQYHRRMRRDISGQIARASAIYRVSRAAPGLAVQAARLWPGALGWLARLTRVPPPALRHAQALHPA